MSKKTFKWAYEHYRYALLGESGVPGLRSLMFGFEVEDGYDLRRFDTWTKWQREKVRKAYDNVKKLEAQPRKVVRPRTKEKLKLLHDLFHGNVPSKNFKVALMPHVESATMPGVAAPKSRVRYGKDVVWEEYENFRRGFAVFDKVDLAIDAVAEVNRAADSIKGAEVFYIQTGEYQSLNAMSKSFLADTVNKWMMRYDGITPLPRASGKNKDKPEAHYWGDWLNGVVGIAPGENVDIRDLTKKINKGVKEAKERRKKVVKQHQRKYGAHTVAELKKMLVDGVVSKKVKTAVKYELTRRGVKYK